MERYYLIANNKSVNISYLKEKVRENDIIIHFNDDKHYGELKEMKCIHQIFLNNSEAPIKYLGIW